MIQLSWNTWHNASKLAARSFDCGWCSKGVGSNHGYFYDDEHSPTVMSIYICQNCGWPTVFGDSHQYPGPILGRTVKGLPANVSAVYKEMREACKNSLWTATVLLGRKLIMHLSVDVAGSASNHTFVQHIEHLKAANYIPPKSDQWLQLIRTLGNEATHEIKMASPEDAKRIVVFVELLLSFMYEYADDPRSA